MLNINKERELAYVVKVDDIQAIPGKDRVESAIVGGWTIMVRKGQFKPGDLGIYFEIDSKVPDKEPFKFLEGKHFKIKTQKYKIPDGKFWSQGLLMHPDDFGWIALDDCIEDSDKKLHFAEGESRFLTSILGVKYSAEEDNSRKAKSQDRYKVMAARHPKIFSNPLVKKIMRFTVGKNIMFLFFGKSSDKKKEWPDWVKKTDEERVENMTWILNSKDPWIATEKIDGTSTTFTLKRGKWGRKPKFFVCSRNVVFDKPEKEARCFYDSNVYTEMAAKYNIESVLTSLLDTYNLDWVTIQGETYGSGIQKRDYGMTDHDFAAFNLITSDKGRWGTIEASDLLGTFGVPFVPILHKNFYLPDSVEALREYSDSAPSVIDGKIKEGIVFRDQDGVTSFKCVSPNFLMQYHNG